MIKLSIITVNLNNASGLKKTMESVLAQSFKDFEYLIIDGKSTDGSKELIEQLANKDKRLTHWLSEPDKGVYNAMNKGIGMASGEYVLFLNSGDYLVKDDVLSSVFNESPTADFILTTCEFSVNNKTVSILQPPTTITFNYLYKYGISHQSTFIKLDMFKKYGLYREDLKYNSDMDFWFKTIVYEQRTTQTIDVILTNYNLEGISSVENNRADSNKESDEIYGDKRLKIFLPDYKVWNEIDADLSLLYWIRDNKALYFINRLIYKMSKKIRKNTTKTKI